MQEFEPKIKNKVVTKEFLAKYAYILVLAVLLIGGISYGYTFFVQNRKIASGSITTAALTINFSNRNISASNLSVPSDDTEGLLEFSKSLTVTNQTAVDGRVRLYLTRTSGLALSDMRYAILVNGVIQEIDDVPNDGEILSSAILGNEVMNVEVKLWPKTSYSGNLTTFVGELTPEIRYLGNVATDSSDLAGKYVNFNCSNSCEVWRIVKVESDRLVLTKQANYEGATSRTNSNRYNPASFNPIPVFNDDSMITSLSTDGLNVYLAKTVKIDGGSGTQEDPYDLVNTDFREGDKKVVAVVTYKDGTTTIGTQNLYYSNTNYMSQNINNAIFEEPYDPNSTQVMYKFGDVLSFDSDVILYAGYAVSISFVNQCDVSIDGTYNPPVTISVYSDSNLSNLVDAESFSSTPRIIYLPTGTFYLVVGIPPAAYNIPGSALEKTNTTDIDEWTIKFEKGVDHPTGGFSSPEYSCESPGPTPTPTPTATPTPTPTPTPSPTPGFTPTPSPPPPPPSN